MKVIYGLVLIMAFDLRAEESYCLPTGLEAIQNFATDVKQLVGFPKMKMNYSVDADCRYTVISEVIIPSDIQSIDTFMKTKIVDPKVNLASADRKKVLGYSMKPEHDQYKQVITTVRNGVAVNIVSKCSGVKTEGNKSSVSCKVDTGATKVKGFIKVFEENEMSIICTDQGNDIKKCIFKTQGLANSIPLVGNACDLAAPGAAETFESTYRLAYFVANGNLSNLESGKRSVNRMYTSSKNHKDLGKRKFVISDEVK